VRDVEDAILEHVKKLGGDIWRLRSNAVDRFACLCTAAVGLLFNHATDLNREDYTTYMRMVFQVLHLGAWKLWQLSREERRT